MDHRDFVKERGSWYSGINEQRKVVMAAIHDGYADQEIPFEWKVCETCDGKGRHVNPSIDSHGLTADDFAEDPDFAEDYFSGVYDEPCYECHGRKKVPVIDLENMCEDDLAIYAKWRKRQDEREREEAMFAAECAAERRMGA